jgi:2-polyprenyl-3-methyl-5-hydroxy-6-metoxy-1,4-benzoquinol methylase
MNYLNIYTQSFNDATYSNSHHIQYDYVIDILKLKYKQNDTFSIIDIGSGRGQLISLIKNNFVNCNITSVDLKKFHPYEVNTFIPCDLSNSIDRNNLIGIYDVLVSTDVFEHLDKSFIQQVIQTCSKLSKFCIFAIANHSDILNGIELHTIQEPYSYWNMLLEQYFIIKEFKIVYGDRLYLYSCILQ